ncbi:MAG: hypothetical protein HY270_07535 [Deltaproteobacteria bacterium]|nr:hypothetical protein [Deltaproteobacteria bacterium]
MTALAYRDVLVFDDEGVLKDGSRLSLRRSLRVISNKRSGRVNPSGQRQVARMRLVGPKA